MVGGYWWLVAGGAGHSRELDSWIRIWSCQGASCAAPWQGRCTCTSNPAAGHAHLVFGALDVHLEHGQLGVVHAVHDGVQALKGADAALGLADAQLVEEVALRVDDSDARHCAIEGVHLRWWQQCGGSVVASAAGAGRPSCTMQCAVLEAAAAAGGRLLLLVSQPRRADCCCNTHPCSKIHWRHPCSKMHSQRMLHPILPPPTSSHHLSCERPPRRGCS